MISFGRIIGEARASKGLSQGELAKKTDISNFNIQRIESEPLSAPKKHDVLQLAYALDLDFNELWIVAAGERTLLWCQEEHIEPEYLASILRKSQSVRGIQANG